MEMLAVEHGVPSFKIFMFYGGYGLHGRTDADAQPLSHARARRLR